MADRRAARFPVSDTSAGSAVAVGRIDVDALRTERLARLQAAMRATDLEACVLFGEPNIRYATGATAMPVYSMSTFARCAVVAAEGNPILFEHGNSAHRSALRAVDVRTMHPWEFFDDAAAEARVFAHDAVAALREVGVRGGRVGLDRVGTPALRALEAEGVTLVDSSPATQQAREVKTPQEINALRLNGGYVSRALHEFLAAIEPGLTERDLLAVYASAMLQRGAEYLATNTVCSGPNTNPWRAEATDRVVGNGDLVFIDTDTVGVEGYFFCVSRTFRCGDRPPTPEQREAYRAAHDWLLEMTDLVRPGVTCGELARTAPPIPERFLPQRYEAMIHGIGLEEENPSVCHPRDPQPNGRRVIQEDMALVVEIYAGVVGGSVGVKLGDEVLVTADGVEMLAPFPYALDLLP
jgi:Xaa-Pro dipeptidase